MSIFEKLKDKMTDVIVEDFLMKLEDKVDLMDRRMQRRFRKLEEKEDQFNALLGLEEFKGSPIKDRAKVVFAKKETVQKTSAEYGDIIGVDRGLYRHFGIYIGNDRVIHFAGPTSDFDFKSFSKMEIREDSMTRFLLQSKSYFVFDCEAKENKSIFTKNLLVAYSPEETVQRAKSKLGENKYNLAINNCEHFAIWCKTGLHKSKQVDKVLQALTPLFIKVRI
ncbi:lecithin retinol acyltransferase family protein [Neobacillus sp. YX16]|uniref:lecithin retinol acyltransferase family protein n=1 Tax=Neobacillus sp. YX16 TaxID=3047874 RepID=UPI0024C456FB|nr:lecithin retinol acyltransferase family protein [Neobacillus sp. YX16]WHZ02780.1 lecithin retinol acyltransferase family protein [Neobacillus sp. YX16]